MAKRGETRQRIIDGARDVFNAQRYGQVTTAALAAHLGLSEGNLWYHFKTKRDLLTAIQTEFLADTQRLLNAADGTEDPIAAYCDFLVAWRDLFTRYLFVFRDRSDYGAHSPDLISEFPALYAALEDRVTALFSALADAGLLVLEEGELPDLVLNTILVTRFYFEFQEERGAATPQASEDAVLRHQSLIQGRLSAEVMERARAALVVDCS